MTEYNTGEIELLKSEDRLNNKPIESAEKPDKMDESVEEAQSSAKVDAVEDEEENTPTPWWKWLIRFIVLFIVVGGIIFIIVRRDITRWVLESFFNWLSEHRFAGPIALFSIFVVA